MLDFVYHVPTKIVFGRKAEEKAGELCRECGAHRVLLHYGGRSAQASGLIGRVRDSLERAGLGCVELGGAVPNPRLSKVREGRDLALREGVDLILGVGGGSAIDSAKAIAYAAAEPGKDVWELFARRRKAEGCLPVGAIPTIAAAGSEMSNSCVISNDATGEKRSYNDDIARPRFAAMDPELTMTLPAWQTASGCADILMHTMERYFTNGGNMDLTDALAEGLLRTVMRCALILRDDPHDYDARAEVMWAGSLSHNGLTGCGCRSDFASHMIEHELGGMFDVTHGAGLTAVWGSWARYVFRNCLPRFEKFALRVMEVEPGAGAEETALRGIAAMEGFFRSIGLPVDLEGLGVSPTDGQIEQMARSAAEGAGGGKGSAMFLRGPDIAAILRMAR
ncbi:MAG: iron-containing alcohol dehydrogenase [Desulfovibrio sp.]|jgi:alcohol dehydrogenase YqhD (iron-dependent ADH family)|nr:iron-containing alcohol dehydrogenase [Mailhella sp.]